MNRFQVTIRCQECHHRYKRVLAAEDESALAAVADPPCPRCSAAARAPKPFDFASRKAPGVGGSLTARAVDTTAEIVMQDYGMTDLRSDVREGESAAPKLAPRLQAAADNMFARRPQRGGAGVLGLPPRSVLQAAVNGRFSTADTVNPISIQHAKRDKPPIHIVAGDGVTPKR